MPFQPDVSEEDLRALLREIDLPANETAPVTGGQIARTFCVFGDGAGYIVQFNHDNLDANFEKAAFAYRRFASEDVPIPEVLRVGRWRGLHFCVTRKAPGRPLATLSPAEQEAALPSVMDTLDAIHATDVADLAIAGPAIGGSGRTGGSSSWTAASWRDYLRSVRDEERADGFYGKWHHLFHDGILERPVFDRVFAAMEDLLPSCTEERSLVHGNFGFRNILIVGDRVSAVVDWLDARLGDFLYDVAGLDIWHPEHRFRERFRERYAIRGTAVPDFERRLLCYQCYLALDAFRFFAKRGDAAAYCWTKERILGLLGSGNGNPTRGAPTWSSEEALRAAAGRGIEAWIHSYLTGGDWANPGLSEGLRLARRWWRGPLLAPLSDLARCCGPEEGMEFREDPDAFDASVERIRRDLRDPLGVPPLIAEYRSGVHSVRDGSHRLEAMRRSGWRAAWVVIWYNREEDFRQDEDRCREWGPRR